MQPSTIERALHKWSPWRESISKARLALGYSPLPSGEKLSNWQWDYDNKVWNCGIKELQRIDLPRSAIHYWCACFYSDYIQPDGNIDYDAIRSVTFVPPGEFGEKAYPSLYEYSVTIGASTRQQLLRTKIQPVSDAIRPLPRDLEKIIKSIRGRKPQWEDIQVEVKQGSLTFEETLGRIAESGDMQAEWRSIKEIYRTEINRKKERRKLLNRIYGAGNRIWERAGLTKTLAIRGDWSRDLFIH